MTWSEAFGIVEQKLAALDCRDEFGDPMFGLEALPRLNQSVGTEWSAVLDETSSGKLKPQDYVRKLSALIEKYRSDLFLIEADRKLNELMTKA